MANLTKKANSRQSLANVPMTWQRLSFQSGDFGSCLRKHSNEMVNGSFESGDFDDNGKLGEYGEYGENSPQSSRCKSDKMGKLPLGKW